MFVPPILIKTFQQPCCYLFLDQVVIFLVSGTATDMNARKIFIKYKSAMSNLNVATTTKQ